MTFLKSLRDSIISKSDRTDEMEIFQNTCVFTVRLHLRNDTNARRNLARTFFFLICYGYASEQVSGPPSGLDLGPISVPKIDPKPVWGPSGKVSNFGHRF